MTPDSIHNRLQLVLVRLAWSQERLAQEIHSDPATISRWLNGKVKPSKTALGRIAHATHVDLEWLLTGNGRMRPHDAMEPSGRNQRELLEMVAKVIAHGGDFAQALADNIRMYYRALSMEEEMRGLEEEVVAMRNERQQLKGAIKEMEKRQIAAVPPDYQQERSHH